MWTLSIKTGYRLAAALILCALFFCCAEFCFAEETEAYTMEDGTVLTYTYKTAKAVSLTGVTPGEGVEELVLPGEFDGKRLVEIEENAFEGCSGLKDLTLPRTVTSMWNVAVFRSSALDGCTALESITVEEDNPAYFSQDGVLFAYGYVQDGTADRTKRFVDSILVFYPPEKPDTHYMVPFGVDTILRLCSNHLEVLEIPGKMNDYIYGSPEELPALKTVVFYQTALGLYYDQMNLTKKTLVLGSGKRLSEYKAREANIVSFAGSDAESWAEEAGYSFQALAKPKLEMEDVGYIRYKSRFFDDPLTFKVKINSDMPFETASENPDVAVMDQNGIVTVKKPGLTRLHAYIKYDGTHLPADCNFTLEVYKVFRLAKQDDYVVESGTRTVQLLPIDKYPGLKLKYKSKDESKLTVDQNGKVTILTTKPGRYQVDIINEQETDLVEACTYSCYITIERIEQKLSVSYPEKGTIGKTIRLKASAKTGITYENLKPKVASVSSDGKVTFKHPGNAVIRVRAAQTDKYFGKSEKIRIRSVLGKPKVKVKNAGGHSARITWSKVAGAQKYLVYVKYPGQKKYKLAVKKSAKVKGILHRNLKKGKKYSYKVRACVKFGLTKYYSPYSKAVTIRAE